MTNHPKFYYCFFLFAFFLCQPSSTFGQKDFEEGYIITNENDTLYGLVSDRKTGAFGGIYDKIKFKGKKRKGKYGPDRIKEYRIGQRMFRSMYLDGEEVFLKVKAQGFVSHYVYELQEQGEQLVQEIDYLQKESNSNLVRATQGLFGLKRKRLMRFFSDCPPLVQKLGNKEFKYTFEVVDFYNEWKRNQKTY